MQIHSGRHYDSAAEQVDSRSHAGDNLANDSEEASIKIPKPTEADKDYFRSLVPEGLTIETKPMFGNIAGFVNGNMFMGLFGQQVGVRLSEADRKALQSEDGSGDFGPAERPMKEYVALPEAWRSQPEASEPWIHKALAHTAAMPPKVKKNK